MQIVASQNTGLTLGRRDRAPAAPEAEPVRAALPAVIPAPARPQTAPATRHRPLTALLAQLIASVEDMPSSRVRRRADPGVGMNAYQAAARLGPAPVPGKSRLI
jgi:hypothetical protein